MTMRVGALVALGVAQAAGSAPPSRDVLGETTSWDLCGIYANETSGTFDFGTVNTTSGQPAYLRTMRGWRVVSTGLGAGAEAGTFYVADANAKDVVISIDVATGAATNATVRPPTGFVGAADIRGLNVDAASGALYAFLTDASSPPAWLAIARVDPVTGTSTLAYNLTAVWATGAWTEVAVGASALDAAGRLFVLVVVPAGGGGGVLVGVPLDGGDLVPMAGAAPFSAVALRHSPALGGLVMLAIDGALPPGPQRSAVLLRNATTGAWAPAVVWPDHELLALEMGALALSPDGASAVAVVTRIADGRAFVSTVDLLSRVETARTALQPGFAITDVAACVPR